MRMLAGVLGAMILFAGCSSSNASSQTAAVSHRTAAPSPAGAAAPSGGDALFVLPLDAVLPLREPMTSWRFDRALDTALAACVAESGEALDVPERPPPRTAWVHERRYGLMRESVAAEWGYHAPPDPASAALIAAQQSISSDVQAVLDGDPGQPGCLETVGAAVALEADPRWRSFAAVEAMTNGTLEAAAREPAVAAVIGAWADCLETSTGWSFAHPADPFSVFAPADAVSAEEIAVALADVACKDEVGLVAAWSAEEGRQQLELLDTESETVASAMDLQRDVLAAVMSIETD